MNRNGNTNCMVEELQTRIGLLQSENERLKCIIQRYEKKLSSTLTLGGRALDINELILIEQENKRLRVLSSERLSEVEDWKLRYSKLASNLQETVKRKDVEPLQEITTNSNQVQLMLGKENNQLTEQNTELRTTIKLLEKKLKQISYSDHSSTIKSNKRLIEEVKELRHQNKSLRVQIKEMITQEAHFEKLREQEVRLIQDLKLNTHSNLQQQKPEQWPEYERRLRGLEEKINTLIVENDQVLGENAHLRTIIAKNFNTVEQNFDVLRSYDSEHQELQIKIEELLRDNSELKKQINGLTENVYQLKKKGSSKEISNGYGDTNPNTTNNSLDACYKLLEQLQQENGLLSMKLTNLQQSDVEQQVHMIKKKYSLTLDTGDNLITIKNQGSDRYSTLNSPAELKRGSYCN